MSDMSDLSAVEHKDSFRSYVATFNNQNRVKNLEIFRIKYESCLRFSEYFLSELIDTVSPYYSISRRYFLSNVSELI